MKNIKKVWNVELHGRRAGALGDTSAFSTVVEGDTTEQANVALYDRFEHIRSAQFERKVDFHTKIDGYEVSLQIDMEGHGADHPDRVTGCWIENKDGFSASLECLQATGNLTYDGDEETKVPQKVIDKIQRWADELGYSGDTYEEDEDASI